MTDYKQPKISATRHPGSGYYYIICDLCNAKIRQKDSVQINDKYNTLNKLIVCKSHNELTNPQAIPFTTRDRLISTPKLVRPEQDPQFYVNPDASTLPDAPTNLEVSFDALNDAISLSWDAPANHGSSAVKQYVIWVRFQATGATLDFVYTPSNVTTYLDVGRDTTQQYTYQVAAINNEGQGPFSQPVFWWYPVQPPFYEVAASSESDGSILGLADLMPNGDIQFIATEIDLG